MTILRIGTNEKYAEGWGAAFGKSTGKKKSTEKPNKKRKATTGNKKKSSQKKSTKIKVVAKQGSKAKAKPAKKSQQGVGEAGQKIGQGDCCGQKSGQKESKVGSKNVTQAIADFAP